MIKMASYSEPMNSVNKRDNVLQRKLKAAFDRFIAADDQTKAARKAREEDRNITKQ